MRKMMLMVGAVFLLALLAACDGGTDETSASGDALTLKYGHSAPAADPGGIFADKVAEELGETTEGALEVEVFPASQLGGEVEMVEQLRSGTIDLAFVTSGALSNFVPEIGVLDMPFLFRDLDHAHQTLRGEIGEELKDLAREQGYEILTFLDYGEGHLVNNKHEIRTPADVEGLKMRTLENDIFVDTFKALGADPVPIPFTELYTSIQQGVVDGTDAVNVVMTGGKLYEVTDHYTEIAMNYRAGVLLMDKEQFDSLEDGIQASLMEVVEENNTHYHDVIFSEYEEGAQELIAENGVKIISNDEIDREPFREAVQSVYDTHEDRFGDLVERITEVE
ncbi:TRAP transporter substrate-binding protein [Virgibacillus xinjiangensis]|uniref:TRAP transporter substrate-binding protein n=1 Tax=Virgibacillus xinjiangensis TaxID=393090 RepID=A0ABV7CZF8_9BACI